METTRLSSKGQVILPKALRDAYHWGAGQELVAIAVGDGILLKPRQPFQETTLAEVAGCLHYQGKPKSLDGMENLTFMAAVRATSLDFESSGRLHK